MRKKVIFVVKSLGSGGIENYLLRFIKYSRERVDPYVLCKDGVRSHLDEEYEKNGATIIYTKIGYFPTLSWLSFVKLIRRDEFDVIVDFTGDFSALTLVGAWIGSTTRRIVFYRNSRYTFKKNSIKLFYTKISNRLVKKFSTKILSNSFAALDYFHPDWKETREKYEVIYNGVPAAPYLKKINKKKIREKYKIPHNAFVIGHVGRFVAGKNHNLIIEIVIELCQKYDDIYVLLCGKGVKKGVDCELKDLNLEDRIIMPGVIDDVPDALRIMNVFFFPSIVEGQPNALIEAMLSNLPIVTSDIAPIKECMPPTLTSGLISLDSDPNVFFSQIENIYLNGLNNKQIDIQSWATEMYSPDKNFNKFLKHLV
jgi:glycosyltransferase involved in cell wall biosynthesis